MNDPAKFYTPAVPGMAGYLTRAKVSQPGRRVGGDFRRLFHDWRAALAAGDVSGKGALPALLMATACHCLITAWKTTQSPAVFIW